MFIDLILDFYLLALGFVRCLYCFDFAFGLGVVLMLRCVFLFDGLELIVLWYSD